MNVDAIFVISVKEATKRRKKFDEQWKSDLFNHNYHIVERQEDPKKGCFESHTEVLKIAKQKQYQKVLIMEDDAFPVKPVGYINETVNRDIKYLDNNDPKWEYYMLGYFPMRSHKTGNEGILKLKCAYLAHAYIANIPNIEIPTWNGFQVDDVLFCDMNKKLLSSPKTIKMEAMGVYGAYPMLAIQQPESSYINQFHMATQEVLLHKIGQDNVAKASCYINIIYFMTIITYLVIVGLALIIITNISNIQRKTKIGLISLFIIVLLILVILMFVD